VVWGGTFAPDIVSAVMRWPALLALDRPMRRIGWTGGHDMESAARVVPRPTAPSAPARPRVVIVGAGFGGLYAAHTLGKAPIDVTLIDRRNYHLFQPLLYQVATAGLSPADIAYPIRSIFRRHPNIDVMLGKVTGVDLDSRNVIVGDRRVPYDQLVIATGARHAYFGHDEWEAYAPGLKKIEDATEIRRRVLLAFERAEEAEDDAARRRLLTFVIVGGGPTGVEMAGAVAELAHKALGRDFRHIDPKSARIVLVEAAPRVLLSFPESLSETARSSLERLGVEVRLGKAVTACDATGVMVGDERIDSETLIWAAGVAASPAARWLGAEKDRAGRVKVNRDLTLPGRPEVFVIGDTAAAVDERGKPYPGVAPVAKQQGAYVARTILARLRGEPAEPFRYRDYGNLATIGRKSAVVDFGWLRLSGFLAWLLWGIVHISFLIGFRNRLVVLLEWMWAYLTFQRGARLITGDTDRD
jgi:NADH dehydrogenase